MFAEYFWSCWRWTHMNVYAVCFMTLAVSLVAAGTFLIATEHYAWAWIPWMVLCCLQWRPTAHQGKAN